jgi:succinate dehydrogenase/fumarate reductase flavoprotein subunit
MGGGRREPDVDRPAFRRRECAVGPRRHRPGQLRLTSPCSASARRVCGTLRHRAASGKSTRIRWDGGRRALAVSRRRPTRRPRVALIATGPAKLMQDPSVSTPGTMVRAREGIAPWRERATRVRVEGNRQYNAGWVHRARARQPSPSRRRSPVPRLECRESRGAHFREDHPAKDASAGTLTSSCKGPDGERVPRANPRNPPDPSG